MKFAEDMVQRINMANSTVEIIRITFVTLDEELFRLCLLRNKKDVEVLEGIHRSANKTITYTTGCAIGRAMKINWTSLY